MKYSYASIGMILFGLMAFVVVLVFHDITINNESDYYSLKEAVEASMYEAIDIAYYRDTETDNSYGEIKIIEEKFVANFTRRFVNNTMGDSNGYVLEFYDIMENPPKVSVKITNKTGGMIISEEDFDVVNNLSGIIEAKSTKSISPNNDICADGESLAFDTTDKIYYVTTDVSQNLKYLYYRMNKPSISGANKVWIKSVSFGPNDIKEEISYSDAYQKSSYYSYKDSSSTVVPTNGYNVFTSNNASNVAHGSTCNTTYRFIPDIDISVVDYDGSGVGDGYPMIRISRVVSDDLSFNAGESSCTQTFQYHVTWEYAYCSSSG